MPNRPRIQFDLSRSRNRASQRTNEASLIVGKRGTSSELVSVIGTNLESQGDQDSQRTHSTRNKPMKIAGNDTDSRMISIRTSDKADKDSPQLVTSTIDSIPETRSWARLPVKFHESGKSSDNVILDPSIVPGAAEGDVGELKCEEGSSRKLYFIFKSVQPQSHSLGSPSTQLSVSGKPSPMQGGAGGNSATTVSVKSGPIQKLLDLKPRSIVLVQPVSKEEVEADVLELYIKDLHLSRGDMWNLASLLVSSCVYRTQRLSFLQGSIRADVQRIYRRGKKVFSAYVGENTRVVFRSESARLVVFIQISLEMWHFEESGQQMFYKLVNSLFPKVFKRWKKLGTHHLISIVLFTSVDLNEGRNMKYAAGERPPKKQDYYRVVVDQVSITLWNEIMATLRLEFANFKRDILLGLNQNRDKDHPQQYLIKGNFLPAVKGNLLEAINLGTSLVSDDFRDPDLRQTTNHFIIISPGNGLFDVNYDMLLRTGKMLATVDSTIDVICLSQPPLHVVPLFRYLDGQHKTHHCIPNFMDISFWSDSSQSVHQWLPRCKIYELQMMGVMENELTSVSINDLNLGSYQNVVDAMNGYDGDVFHFVGVKKGDTEREKTAHPLGKKAPAVSTSSTLSSYLKRPLSNTTSSVRDTLRLPNKSFRLEEISEAQGFQSKEIASVKASIPTTSNATGVTTTSKPNISAFSSLLSISKNHKSRSSIPRALEFVKRMISSPLSGPLSPQVTAKSSDSSANQDLVSSLSLGESTKKQDTDAQGNLTGQDSDPHLLQVGNNDISQGQIPKSSSQAVFTSIDTSNKWATRGINLKRRQKQNMWNAYWTAVKNPSNVTTSELFGLVSYGRWQFVFPPNVRRRIIKWTSLATPAALPVMTPLFPSIEDFNQNFTFRIYDVLLNPGGTNSNSTSETLMRSMISLRISLGFQICVGEKVRQVEDQRKPNGDSKQLIEYLDKDRYQGSRIYLSLSDEIHRISCDYNGLVNVQVYKRIARSDGLQMGNTASDYVEYIRTRYSEVYKPVTIHMQGKKSRDYNWNQLDQVLAGYGDSVEHQVKYHRLKFAIIPTEVPENSFKLATEKLTPEEIRLEGIRSLVTTINRNRFRTLEERRIRRKKSEIIPEINFYTGNLFSYLDNQANLEFSGEVKQTQLFQTPMYSKTISLTKLASALQGNGGIKIADRKWHLILHYHCFTGMDLVSWLIENFDDIDDREEAVNYGNTLMERGLFRHVKSKHHFLDGHYFYELNVQYLVKPESEKDGGVNGDIANEVESKKDVDMKDEKHMEGESEKTGNGAERNRKKSNSKEEDVKTGDQDYDATSHKEHAKTKRKVVLSRKVLYNLDANHLSWQPELMNVHYDIVHNPEHCFHIRLEWLNTTSKLIEDTVSSWGKHCERYGLELVEIPWDELCTLPLANPLHSTIDIQLALNPWTEEEFAKHKSILKENRYFYHLYLLERCQFMLDNRTANFFRDDRFDVVYSWGRPTFKYAQFIHRTGAYIAELRENGNFFLAPNNPHIARVNLSIGQLQGNNKSTVYFDSQGVMLDFRAICSDRTMLRVIFREALSKFEQSRDVEQALFEDGEESNDETS